MKYITFVRHSKSSWDSFSLPDHERPLNNRGKRDSIFMGKKILSLGYNPQLIVSSSATRAMNTARNIAKELNTDNIIFDKNIYEALSQNYLVLISKIDNSYDDILLVGHNPTLTDIINNFSSEFIPNVPTTGIFKVQFDINSWIELSFETGQLLDFIYPKMFKNEI